MKTNNETKARKALQCLYLEVDVTIANDIQQKVLAAFAEIKEIKFMSDDEIKRQSLKHRYDEKSMWFMQKIIKEANK